MRKFTQYEAANITNEDIEDYLIDYLHNKSLQIIDGYLVDDNQFVTDVAETNDSAKKCKKIEFSIEKDLINSIEYEIRGKTMFSFRGYDEYNKVLKEIKRFFSKVKKPPIFSIDQSYEDIDITLFLIGEKIDKKTFSKKGEIDNLLLELGAIMKVRGYKNTNLSTNHLTIKVKKYPLISYYDSNSSLLCDIIRKAYKGSLINNERNKVLIEWAQRVNSLGYKIALTGYDNSISVKLY